MTQLAARSAASQLPASLPRSLFWLATILFLAAALVYGWFAVFSGPMSLDEGYLMISIQGFVEGHPLYDSVFTHYGPFYYLYEWILRSWLAVPLTHDATRLLCLAHWLAAAALLGWAGGLLTRSPLGGLFVFAQAVVHLKALANEPGHPQELVVMLLALAVLLAASLEPRARLFGALAVLGAALAFTKINVGAFYLFALLLAMRCHSRDLFTRGPWPWLLLGLCALLPFVLMRSHLAAPWCRNFALLSAGAIVSALLLARASTASLLTGWGVYLKTGASFVVAALALAAFTLGRGTSLQGLADGLLLNPLRMPGGALLPVRLPTVGLLNGAAALALACVWAWPDGRKRIRGAVTILQGLYGLAGAFCLVGEAQFQLKYLLPWVWLALVPGPADRAGDNRTDFARVLLCLVVSWQALQAYPIAGTQVVAATFLMVPLYALCLGHALRAVPVSAWRQRALARLAPGTFRLIQTAALAGFLGLFVNIWCKLPQVRQHHASLEPLSLPGSERVRMDAESVELYRALASYLETECDTFVTYPGINSLYFWTKKRPPTQLNSTGWAQLSHRQQEHILGSLRQFKRPMVVVVEASMKTWDHENARVIRPLIRYVREDCRPIRRIGRFLIFVPNGPQAGA